MHHWNFTITITMIEKVFLNPHIRLQNTFKINKGCKNHQLCYPCTNIPQTTEDKNRSLSLCKHISLFNMDIGVIKDICWVLLNIFKKCPVVVVVILERLDKNLLSVRND